MPAEGPRGRGRARARVVRGARTEALAKAARKGGAVAEAVPKAKGRARRAVEEDAHGERALTLAAHQARAERAVTLVTLPVLSLLYRVTL